MNTKEYEDGNDCSQQYIAKVVLETAEHLIRDALDENMLREFERELRALTWLSDQKLEGLQKQRIKSEILRGLEDESGN